MRTERAPDSASASAAEPFAAASVRGTKWTLAVVLGQLHVLEHEIERCRLIIDGRAARHRDRSA